MRKLASIVEIATCDPIPDTERLSVATMVGKGGRVGTGRDEFKPGDLAVYFEIDSYRPPDDERYAFLHERCLKRIVSKGGGVLREGVRIKTAKLRGVISQGLLMPLAKFPEAVGLEVGADVSPLLKVEHYDEVKEMLQPAMGNPLNSDVMGDFPGLIPKSDEERLQGGPLLVRQDAFGDAVRLPAREPEGMGFCKGQLFSFSGIGECGNIPRGQGSETLRHMAHTVGEHQSGHLLGQIYSPGNSSITAAGAHPDEVVPGFQHETTGRFVKGGYVAEQEF